MKDAFSNDLTDDQILSIISILNEQKELKDGKILENEHVKTIIQDSNMSEQRFLELSNDSSSTTQEETTIMEALMPHLQSTTMELFEKYNIDIMTLMLHVQMIQQNEDIQKRFISLGGNLGLLN